MFDLQGDETAMIYSPSAREIAIALQRDARLVFDLVSYWLSKALSNSHGEVSFVRELVTVTDGESILLSETSISVSSTMLHQKPYVVFDMNGVRERCELADLLVVVTYQEGKHVVERKSILYQAKVQYADDEYEEGTWNVQANQQYCLARFPEMWPARSRNMKKPMEIWKVSPRTLDLGCYLLLTRNRMDNTWRFDSRDLLPYALAPSATAMSSSAGARWVDHGYTYHAANRFTNHILFETGEPHNAEVDKFIAAVLSAAGTSELQPPTTCYISKNYNHDGTPIYDDKEKDKGGFGFIQVTVQAHKGKE
jgi:hypothetical protein